LQGARESDNELGECAGLGLDVYPATVLLGYDGRKLAS